MSLLGAFKSRDIDHSSFDMDSPDWTNVSHTGEKVGPRTSMRLTAVYASVTLISGAISGLPVDVFRKEGDRRIPVDPPSWVLYPNDEQAWLPFIEQGMQSLLLHGNMYAVITDRDRGRPSNLIVVDPEKVTVSRIGSERVYTSKEASVRIEQYTARRPLGDMLHVLGPSTSADGLVGLSPIAEAKQAVELGMATEKYGNKFFGQGVQASGVVEMPAGSVPTQAQLDQLSKQFRRKFSGTDNAWRPIIFANGATYKGISLPNDQAQFLETRKFAVTDIARLFGVPPHLIGDVERSTSWGTGIEEQSIGFVRWTLLFRWVRRLEVALSQLLPQGEELHFNMSALMRGDLKSRYEAYGLAITNGWMSRNETRALEDLAPVEGLDDMLVPLNLARVGADDAGAASARELTEMIQKIYLGVGKVLTADEAREILNREGAGLDAGFEPFPLPSNQGAST